MAGLVRLQCDEGLDVASAVYEWNCPRQMIPIRIAEMAGAGGDEGGNDGGGGGASIESVEGDLFPRRFLELARL